MVVCLVRLLGVGEFLGSVLAEIRLEKRLGRRQGKMKVGQRLDPDGQLGGFNIQHVPPVQAVVGDEMKVIALDAERTRESRRPQADQRPVDVAEAELTLCLARIGKASARRRWIDCSGADADEVSIQADRVENISGYAIPVSALFEVLEACQGTAVDMELGR